MKTSYLSTLSISFSRLRLRRQLHSTSEAGDDPHDDGDFLRAICRRKTRLPPQGTHRGNLHPSPYFFLRSNRNDCQEDGHESY